MSKKIVSEVSDRLHERFRRYCFETNQTMKKLVEDFVINTCEKYEREQVKTEKPKQEVITD